MNFLAHLYLSGENQDLTIGNFLGDFVKGSQLQFYSKEIQKGIKLHRAIDFFTDHHSVVKQSKARLRERFRHYTPVIVDIFYDHFLAKDWKHFSDVPLQIYTKRFYQFSKNYHDQLPENAKRTLFYMSKGDWLYHYRLIEGIDQTLKGMAQRTSFPSRLDEAAEALEQHFPEFEKEFYQFFPELQAHVANFISDNTAS